MSEPTETFVVQENLIHSRKQYRAPFKVHLIEWNPKMDLVALASKKGEVLLKRSGWKKCWKVNVSEVVDKLTAADCASSPRSVDSMCWNPRGDILAVGMSDGHWHLIDVHHGVVRWTKRLECGDIPASIQRLRWFDYGADSAKKLGISPKKTASIGGRKDAFCEEGAVDRDPAGEERDERLVDCMALEDMFSECLKGTMLFAIRDDHKVTAIAAGILPVADFDVNVACESLGIMPIFVYDVLYSDSVGGLSVAATTYGPRPHCGGDGTFGVPVVPPNAPTTPHTHVINVALSFRDIDQIWNLVERYIKLYNRHLSLVCVLENVVKEWATHSQIFANRMQPTSNSMNMGEALVASLLSGVNSQLAEAWMERTLASGIAGMREFLDHTFCNLLKSLTGPLSSAVRCLSYHFECLEEELQTFTETCIDDFESLLFPAKNNSVDVYPFDSRVSVAVRPALSDEQLERIRGVCGEIEKFTTHLQAKVHQAILAGTGNIKELQSLVRWLSLSPVLTRSSNRNTNAALSQGRKVETRNLLKYILDTFMEKGDYKTYMEKGALRLDEVIQEMRDEEAEEGYSENAYLRDTQLLDSLVTQTLYPGMPVDEEVEEAVKRAEAAENKSASMTSRRKLSRGAKFSEKSGSMDTEMADDTTNSSKKQPKLDKICEFWTESLSDDVFSLLGSRPVKSEDSDEVDRSTLTSLVADAKSLLTRASTVLGELGKATQVNWLAELASSSTHTAFESVSLTELAADIESTEGEKPAAHSPFARKVLRIVSTTTETCSVHGLLPKDQDGRYSGWQEDLTVTITKGVELRRQPRDNEENEKVEGALSVVLPECPTSHGRVMGICSAKPLPNGHVYVVVKTHSEKDGDMRRMLKLHPKKACHVHEVSFRSDQLESFHLSPDGVQGCSVSDEATRVAIFTTEKPGKWADTYMQSKQKDDHYRLVAEEKRRANQVTAPTYFHVYDGDRVMRVKADEE